MWRIESTVRFERWAISLSAEDREAITAHLLVLREKGPALGRHYVDTIKGSHIKNLKEIRVQSRRKVIRILFVFTEQRIALLLTGGDKRGKSRFYEALIREAEIEYQNYLADQADL
ncbi:MAG: diaminopimelate decarboxylase [Leptonema illini]|uniref:Diaminopimelate decarboxylase n=1 Tax=Leptonema illini TaxID=183 RepID=A0A833H004_9LEPT|nr:MAG: diaminopimelate decarboxylase [Leptonema illini]